MSDKNPQQSLEQPSAKQISLAMRLQDKDKTKLMMINHALSEELKKSYGAENKEGVSVLLASVIGGMLGLTISGGNGVVAILGALVLAGADEMRKAIKIKKKMQSSPLQEEKIIVDILANQQNPDELQRIEKEYAISGQFVNAVIAASDKTNNV